VAASKPEDKALRLYGQTSDRPPLEWSWVESQLTDAGTYWVVAPSAGHPHPRPVWGIWTGDALVLSIGSPVLAASLRDDPRCTVHLDSGTDVVVLEGVAARVIEPVAEQVDAYNRKYEWQYSYDEYGPFTKVTPALVMSWRAAGWAGRDGFQQVGRFDFA
jgi:hypothetical protein